MKHLARAASMLLALIAPPCLAQVPDDIAAKLKEIGAVIDPPRTAALYAPLQTQEPYGGVAVERDVHYAAQSRNLLDVFVPENRNDRPVLIFIHGGGFVRGDKHPPGSPFYDNVMLWAAKNGFVGVNATYRLAPDVPWPAAAEDVAAVVSWVGSNIASRGGDPARVFLMGHSAGAVHVASYVSHPEFHGPNGIGVAGAVLMSGLYQFDADSVGDNERAYLGADPSRYATQSSLMGLLDSKLPLLTTSAEYDPPPFQLQFKQLIDAAGAKAAPVHGLMLAKHSHMSEIYAVNTPDVSFTKTLLAFMNSLAINH